MTRTAWRWMGALLPLVLTGCMQRTIEVTSQPSGALVYLNDEEVGRTPVIVPFTFYGVYDVRLEHDDAEPLWTTRKAAAPLYDLPGPDLVAEAIPGSAVRLHWHFDLTPRGEPDPDAVIDRARQMRATTRRP